MESLLEPFSLADRVGAAAESFGVANATRKRNGEEAAEMLSISRRALDYTAIVDGAAHPLRVIPKGGSYFQFDERYLKRLTDDDFGFRRPAKCGRGLDYTFTIPHTRFRCCPSSLYTKPGSEVLPGLARDCHFRFPRL